MGSSYDTNTTADEIVADLASKIQGKTILTTGVSIGGLGFAFVESIAKAQPGLLIITGRNPEKLREAAGRILAGAPKVKVKTLQLDLNSLAATRTAAEAVSGWEDVPHIDVLVNNAGLMATPYALTADGYESQFGVNHLGHFLFTSLIIKKVLAADAPRIVNVTSDGHRLNPIRWHDYNFDKGRTYNKWHAYGQSKTANMLFTLHLATSLKRTSLLAFSLHPGAVEGTNLGAHCDWNIDYPALMAADKALGNPEGWATEFNFKSQQRGVATFVFAAFDPSLKDHNGAYLLDSRRGDALSDTIKPWATSELEAERLWKLSEQLVGRAFDTCELSPSIT